MSIRRFAAILTLASIGSFAVASVPEYSISIKQAYAAHAAGQRVALLPLTCPQGIECADLEKKYAEQLADNVGLKVVDADAVREVTTDANLGSLSEMESRPILAEGLQVDSFVKVDILQATVEHQPASDQDVRNKWRDLAHREDAVTRLKIEVRVIAKDGKVLARGLGDAQLINSIRGLNAVAARTFQQTLEKLFPDT